jgi:putative transposase
MKKTRFTEEQMVTILREADEKPVPEVAKKHGVSAQTIYGWRKHFGELGAVGSSNDSGSSSRKTVGSKDGRGPRPRDRRPQGDHAKKMVGARVRRQQVRLLDTRPVEAAARAPYSASRGRRWAIIAARVRDAPGMRRCADWRRSIPGTAIDGFGSSCDARDT